MDNPFKIFDEIRSAYLRYLDSPFRLRYDALMKERRALLDKDRQLYREPLIEPVTPYEPSAFTIAAACRKLGIPSDAADFIAQGLFSPKRLLHNHQYKAWCDSREGKAVVVTSGTGSGKTECYLLPLFAYLVEEGMRWSAPNTRHPQHFWWNFKSDRIPQRHSETRPAAMRALLLYPLNALIEDQLGRIRKACDSGKARAWLDNDLRGNRFWFGRYTGLTPVSGSEDNPRKRKELRKRLKSMERDWESGKKSARKTGDEQILTYFQYPSGSEMWSRWDMHDAPPDILITNYSMLNIMLMRGVENRIFDKTREWLASDRERNLFHLVVDELHSYRGTPGTEVGYLLRAFLHRIGLTPDSPQLRIISTSASVNEDPHSLEYLEQFFGRSKPSFSIVPGDPQKFAARSRGLIDYKDAFAKLNDDLDQAALSKTSYDYVLQSFATAVKYTSAIDSPRLWLAECLKNICAYSPFLRAAEQGPATAHQLAESIFSDTTHLGIAAAKGLTRSLVLARIPDPGNPDGVAPLPLRIHYFFHNAGRLWACVNPQCSGRSAETPVGTESPPVGKLFTEPRPHCDACGARVLELLYCQPCGEVFLGGFKTVDRNAPNTWNLSPDYPNLDRVPDKGGSLRREFGEYLVFWASLGRSLAHSTHAGPSWRWQQDRVPGYMWTPAAMDHATGRLALQQRISAKILDGASAGYVYQSPNDEVNAFAARCPHCASDWSGRRTDSPIRDLGSGFQRIVQLLCDAMMREMPQDKRSRKLVLFSDSRQDAAKLSTGIKRDHHLDTLRQIAYHRLQRETTSAASAFNLALERLSQAEELLSLQRKEKAISLSAEESTRRNVLLAALPDSGEVLKYALIGGQKPSVLEKPKALKGAIALSFNTLLDAAREELLGLGINPGGTQPSLAIYKAILAIHNKHRTLPVRWTELIDWSAVPRRYHTGLQPDQLHLSNSIEMSLKAKMIEDVLFASGSRDFESLGLGFLYPTEHPPSNLTEYTAASVTRLLAKRRRWDGSGKEGRDVPSYVTKYVEKAASVAGLNASTLLNDVENTLGNAINQWLVIPGKMFVQAPTADANGYIDVYDCSRCGRTHLHLSAGICTSCLRILPSSPRKHPINQEQAKDFYEYLARCSEPPFRLNCEELTGQTNPVDRKSRQRRFQEVFMENEEEDTAGVDLLSVTTTMEAGVDIGSLQGISLANMPPVRFNYQQRVGRAGRRGLGMSAALTLCRGRSHDDYYFERPRLITAEPPPPPYVDVTRPEIAQRVVNKEILRRAFESLPLVDHSGDNVHGEFGTVSNWGSNRYEVQKWIDNNSETIDLVCAVVLHKTAMGGTAGLLEMQRHVRYNLLPAIDKAKNHRLSLPHLALSERLASLGILPMFGFPTRIRYLFHEKPGYDTTGFPPNKGFVDRELDIAISQFAPGAQTVKDDELHTSVGVADFRPDGRDIVAYPDPLAGGVPIGICRRCQALVDENVGAATACPYCLAALGSDGYRTVELSEPPGFCTWWSVHSEFDGSFEFTPRALRARIGASQTKPTASRNFVVDRGNATIYRVNDNEGSDFLFEKLAGTDVWISLDAYRIAVQNQSPNGRASASDPPMDKAVQPLTRALAAISSTDVLTAGINFAPVGINLNPKYPEGRAAWYSFGFILRRAAAVTLDVAESELEVGIQPVMDFSSPFAPPSARIFISDSLENGAGYSTHLGAPHEFEKLLEFILGLGAEPSRNFIGPLVLADHETECASSCHRCLREYGNMAYHPLLDWRLGLDMVRLALDARTDIGLHYDYWSSLVERIAPNYFAGLGCTPAVFGALHSGIDPINNEAIILTHPMWDISRGGINYCESLARAVADAQRQGYIPRPHSLLRAVRFPYE
jgi:DEAD/DEAH box helicase domain-containing protein